MKRIVIIEDNAMAANIYQSALSRQGFSVEVATDGELGLAAVVGSPPDLILLDLMLPKIDGAELLRRIRATEIVSKANMSPKQLVSIVGEFIQA